MKSRVFALPSSRAARVLASLLAAASLVLALPRPEAADAAPRPTPRVVAVGDVHGDYNSLVALLQHVGYLDAKFKWAGARSTLVQTGDILDRGGQSRQVMDLLMALEKEAPKKGGRVVVLLGNHEMMNLIGDLRYAAGTYPNFAAPDSEKRRQAAWKSYVAWLKARATSLGKPEPAVTPEMEKAWMEAHPPGYLEFREALAPSGRYGKWLRARPAILRLDGTVYVHGGISPEIASMTPEAIAARVADEIRAFDSVKQFAVEQQIALPFFTFEELMGAISEELAFSRNAVARKQQEAAAQGKSYTPPELEKQRIEILEQFLGLPTWLSIHTNGPLWYRGFARLDEVEGSALVQGLLERWGASRFVVGHTPQSGGRIASRFGNRVLLIDTGMLGLSYFPGGRASALEQAGGKISAVYMTERVVLLDPLSPASSVPATKDDGTADIPGGGVQESSSPAPSQNPPAAVAALAAPARPIIWRDPEGNPLPFKSDEEVMQFLKSAKVVASKDVGTGINRIRKLTLEFDGVRANAAFRDHDEEKDVARMADGKLVLAFRDSFYFENAAYELSRLLGLRNVPPVVLRTIHGTKGSIQIWVEKAMMEKDRLKRSIKPPDTERWNRQVFNMRVFDSLVFNDDRNMGNILIDQDWTLWMIDHTRAFRRYDNLREPEKIFGCDRSLYDALRNFNEAEARVRLRPYLRGSEMDALFKRRVKLVQFLDRLIAEKGEDKILFSLH
jgi:hypothetical protein